jgi:hypothetical protein
MAEDFTYLNFDLLVEDTSDGYRARVLDAPSGQSTPVAFQLPFNDLELENFLLKIGHRRGMRGGAAMEMTQKIKTFGGQLYQSLFHDELQTHLLRSLDWADSQNAGLRIRLRLSDAPELTDLPWEYLYDPMGNRFLCLSDRSPLVRFLDLPAPVRVLPIVGPLRLLVMIANPSDPDLDQLNVEQEWKNLTDALARLRADGRVEIERLDPPSLDAMQRELRRNHYHMLHFIGHGRFDAQNNDGRLLLEDQYGQGRPTSGQTLGTLLYDHRHLRLAVLNACEGARTGRTDPFAGTAQSLIQQGIPAVVAMQFEISDRAAIAFSQTLYETIADGYPVDAATAEARKAIYVQPNPIEWATPVLYLRAPDGRIFDVNPPAATATAPHVTTRPTEAHATTMTTGESAMTIVTTPQHYQEIATDLTDVDETEQSVTATPVEGDWAICCSGGGIRSAAYCLGALQSLDQGGVLAKSKWVLGVSGGSYIAASRALVANYLPAGPKPAYAPGTPEERNLRHNTHQIAPNSAPGLIGAVSLLVGVVVTVILVSAPLFAASHAWGWLLRSQQVLCPGSLPGCHPTGHWAASVSALTWWPWPVVAGVVTFLLFWWWWATLVPQRRAHRDPGQALAKAFGRAALVTVVALVAMLVVPLLLAWLTQLPPSPIKSLVYDLGFDVGAKWSSVALAGVFVAVVAVAQSCRAKLAHGAAQGLNAAQPGLAGLITGWLRVYLLPWLASIAIVLAFAVAGLRWVKDGAAAGYSLDQLWPVLVALAIVLAARALADVNRISMHDFYRWRLASAYSVLRKGKAMGEPRTGRRGAEDFPGVTPNPAALLSRLRPKPDQQPPSQPDSPMLVICATANINAAREVPVGRGGLSMTFDPDHVILRGEGADHDLVAQTRDYEVLIGERRLTLFDVSAISGAPVSPLIGSATRQAHRILFTLTNVRLGVWLPHPAVVVAAHRELELQQSGEHRRDTGWSALGLLLWYVRPWHPRWGRRTENPGGREARLWAYVLRMRQTRKRMSGFFYHMMQPTLGLLWAELAGHNSYRATWICVTDGGHYDNLGLVEAFRRGASRIVVLDASGERADTWLALDDAVRLARADAGVEIALDPTTMVHGGHGLAPGQVVRPWAFGTFTRPQDVPDVAQQGIIWVCKLGWWDGAPRDVVGYAKSHPTFPYDALWQLHDAGEFDAYQQLGAESVRAAMRDAPLRWMSPPASAPGSPRDKGQRRRKLPE